MRTSKAEKQTAFTAQYALAIEPDPTLICCPSPVRRRQVTFITSAYGCSLNSPLREGQRRVKVPNASTGNVVLNRSRRGVLEVGGGRNFKDHRTRPSFGTMLVIKTHVQM